MHASARSSRHQSAQPSTAGTALALALYCTDRYYTVLYATVMVLPTYRQSQPLKERLIPSKAGRLDVNAILGVQATPQVFTDLVRTAASQFSPRPHPESRNARPDMRVTMASQTINLAMLKQMTLWHEHKESRTKALTSYVCIPIWLTQDATSPFKTM